jgi:hypothetical protein
MPARPVRRVSRPYVATATSVDTADRLGDVLYMFLSSSRFP